MMRRLVFVAALATWFAAGACRAIPSPTASDRHEDAGRTCQVAIAAAATTPNTSAGADRSTQLEQAMACLIEQRQYEEALAVAGRAMTEHTATRSIAVANILLSIQLRPPEAAVVGMEDAERQRPEAIAALDPTAIGTLFHSQAMQASPALRLRLYAVLDRTHYASADPFRDIDDIWMAYAADLAGGGDSVQATQVLARVVNGQAFRNARNDPRLAAILRAQAERYSEEAVNARWLAATRAKAQQYPDMLAGQINLANALNSVSSPREALAVLDAANQRAYGDNQRPFTDRDTQLNWLADERSAIFFRLGRYEDALTERGMAATHGEQGGRYNVSQALNYAVLAEDMGRAQLAIDALQRVGDEHVSEYGHAVLATARICAAAQLGRLAEVQADTDWLRNHIDTGPSVSTRALLCANDLDGAAVELRHRLTTSSQRAEALAQVLPLGQPVRGLPYHSELGRRLEAVAQRRDVQAALLTGVAPATPADLPRLEHDLAADGPSGVYLSLRAVPAGPQSWPPPSQLRGLRLLARAAGGLRRLSESLTLYRTLSEGPGATADDWIGRFQSARMQQDNAESLVAIAGLAHAFPASLSEVDDNAIFGAFASDDLENAEALQFNAGRALTLAHWSPTRGAPDTVAESYVLGSVIRGDIATARSVARQMTEPSVLVRLMIDKRFDALGPDQPTLASLRQAVDLDLARRRRDAAAHPDQAFLIYRETLTLYSLGRFDEALAIDEAALARIADAHARPYSDLALAENWLHDERARLLAALGRYDDAVAEYTAAIHVSEIGGDNVSQRINLAGFLASLGRSQEALDYLGSTPENLSPFGWMAWHAARVCALAAHPDAAAADLAYLRAHQADASNGLFRALLCIDDEPGAAAVLIGQLSNPLARTDVLNALQDYPQPEHSTPWQQTMRERRQAVLARPAAAAAINAVGRILQIPFY
jgi:tetratricopeptide (TPR) repeat protein